MKGSSHLKTAVVSALVGAITATGTVALAGTGIGGIFNLGQPNTVNATSSLSGASTGAQLQVTNTGTGTGAQGIAASNNSAAATLYGRNSGTGPAISGRADKKNNGVEGVSAGSGASGVYGANTSTNGFGVAGRSTGAAGIGVYGNNTGGGLGVLGKSTGNSGVQGTTASDSSSGVYGENTSGFGYGVAGRAGSSGYGVYGENTGSGRGVVGLASTGSGVAGFAGNGGSAVYGDNSGTGWAGYFEDKVHIGGALDCPGCDFIRGGGKAVGQAVVIATGAQHVPLGPPMAGFLRLSYDCGASYSNGGLHVYNDSGSPANVFVESGEPNPTYYAMPASGPGQELIFDALGTGDSFHIQAQGPLGVLTIEVATVNRASDCHAQAQALLTGT